MKQAFFLSLLLAFCFLIFPKNSFAQEKLDLPGDNLNLYAVLKLFQESPTLEGFEKSLNDKNNNINNLDLNSDGKTDYIKVIDNAEGEVHNIALRVAVNKNEDQDVAVFNVQKDANGQVQIQLIGDEALYGKDYIVEPNYGGNDAAQGTPNPGYTTPELSSQIEVQTTTPAQTANWNVVRYIYQPGYVVWRSPWRWGYYPSYWHPWTPYYWHTYYGYHYHWDYYYFGHYRRWNYYRYPSWRDYYYRPGYRSFSPYVQTRVSRGDYRKTYARPDLAKQGSAMFRKDFPKAPSVNDKLPAFDKTGRPVPVTRPVTTPVTKPAITQPVTRPVTKPVITQPVTRPVTKPVTKPVITQPVTRPVTKPVITKPVTRPVTTRPVTHPVTRPVTKPITRPVTKQPLARPQVKPAMSRPMPSEKK